MSPPPPANTQVFISLQPLTQIVPWWECLCPWSAKLQNMIWLHACLCHISPNFQKIRTNIVLILPQITLICKGEKKNICHALIVLFVCLLAFAVGKPLTIYTSSKHGATCASMWSRVSGQISSLLVSWFYLFVFFPVTSSDPLHIHIRATFSFI